MSIIFVFVHPGHDVECSLHEEGRIVRVLVKCDHVVLLGSFVVLLLGSERRGCRTPECPRIVREASQVLKSRP